MRGISWQVVEYTGKRGLYANSLSCHLKRQLHINLLYSYLKAIYPKLMTSYTANKHHYMLISKNILRLQGVPGFLWLES